MARQTRNTNTASGDGFNFILAGKSSVQRIAQLTGNPEYANWSSRGISFIMSAQEHLTETAIINVLKENLLEYEFSKSGSIDGYSLDTIPLYERSKIKDRLWKENTNYEGIQGKWSPMLITLRENYIENYIEKIKKIASVRTLEDMRSTLGAIGLLATSNDSYASVRADLSNPEFIRLIELHDSDPITPVISGKTGAGKSNFVLHTFRMAGRHNRGYINPKHGIRSRLRAYLPNFNGDTNDILNNAEFPDIPSSYSYRYPWQIFIDQPKGASILWTKYDWSLAQEEENDDSAGIFSMVYLGEIGLGKLQFAQSREVNLYKSLFQLTRQMRIRYYLSSANPSPIPVGVMQDFVQPQIWIDINKSETRIANADYLMANEMGTPITKRIKLGEVPLDPLTKKLGKGIASDMTSAWQDFPLREFLERTRLTNMQLYFKDPDAIMDGATNFVLNFQDNYLDEVEPMQDYNTAKPTKPAYKKKEEDSNVELDY